MIKNGTAGASVDTEPLKRQMTVRALCYGFDWIGPEGGASSAMKERFVPTLHLSC